MGPGIALPFAENVAFYGVVGDVDLRRDALCPDALLGVGETVGMEALDQFPAFPVHLIHGGAWGEAQPVVGGEDVGRIAKRGKRGRRCPPTRVPVLSTASILLCGLFCHAALFGPTPLFGGTPPGRFEGIPEGLATLAAAYQPFAEAIVRLQAGYETLGETPQTAWDAHGSFLSPASQ